MRKLNARKPALLVVGMLAGCGAPAGGDLAWRAVAEGADSVQITGTGGRLVVDVWSPTGIGHAILERSDAPPPGEVWLRFHLQGLERLRIDYGRTVELSVSSTPPFAWHCSVVSDDLTQTAVDRGSPYWMPVRLVAARGAPGNIPLRDGTIEVGLPRDAQARRIRRIDLDWIDFYR